MRRGSLFALVLVAPISCSLIGCASTSGIEEEMSKMRRDLVAMRKELSDTQLAVQRLEGQITLLSVGRGRVERAPETEVAAAEAPAKKKAAAAKSSRVLPVVRLGNKAEVQSEDEAWIDPGAVDDGSPPLVITLGPDEAHEKDRITVDHDVLKKPDPVLGKTEKSAEKKVAPNEATSADIEAEYQAALAKLRGEGKPQEALALFAAFREKHPRSNLADNAAYWSGECHFAMQAHERAIAEFSELVREYPRSSKRADAMVRIGESWLALANPKKAGEAFSQVIDAYPKTDAAGRARARLSTIPAEGGK
jgi:tol-pal system protein YbgF